MKKGLCIVGFLVLAAQLPLWGYDTSPSSWQIVPEVIWAGSAGAGGTWVTELQITNLGASTIYVSAYFDTAGGSAPSAISLGPIPALNSVKYYNILQTMDTLDPSATVYFGKVGALYLRNLEGATFQVQAQTVNGNYGKTFPGLNIVEGNTIGTGRPMMIQGLIRNAAYRTSVGIYNPGTTSYTVKFTIVNATNATVGTAFEKTVGAYGFQSFNVFTQAAAPVGDYDNCWLYLEVVSGGSGAEAPMFFGSLANNYTNDTYALLARQYVAATTTSSAPIRH